MRGLLIAVVATLALAAPASAFETVLQDDDLLLHSGPETADATLEQLKAMGVDRVRFTVVWPAVAPGFAAEPDPGRLAPHDHLLRSARRIGIETLVTISGGQGAKDPDPAAYGRFVEALGRRWDGTEGRPRVSAWTLWNEPNWGGLLQPQHVRVTERVRVRAKGRTRTVRRKRWIMRSPVLYRRLHRAGAAALQRTGHGGDQVLLGDTAPRGDRKPGTTRPVQPVTFLAAVLCLDHRTLEPLRGKAARDLECRTREAPLLATGLAHHPYGVTDAPWTPARSRFDAGLADAARLTRVLDAAARAGRLPAGLPLWWTEHGYETNPPDPRRGLDPELVARWLGDAERLARQTPRVAALTQFLLQDTPLDARFPSTDQRHFRTYQSGLRYADGGAKPALEAFRFPLSVPAKVAPGAPVPVWGLLRAAPDPRGAKVVVEAAPQGSDAFTEVASAEVADPSGAFTVQVPPLAGTARLRLSWQPPAPPRPSRQPSPLDAVQPPPPDPAPPAPVRSRPLVVAVG